MPPRERPFHCTGPLVISKLRCFHGRVEALKVGSGSSRGRNEQPFNKDRAVLALVSFTRSAPSRSSLLIRKALDKRPPFLARDSRHQVRLQSGELRCVRAQGALRKLSPREHITQNCGSFARTASASVKRVPRLSFSGTAFLSIVDEGHVPMTLPCTLSDSKLRDVSSRSLLEKLHEPPDPVESILVCITDAALVNKSSERIKRSFWQSSSRNNPQDVTERADLLPESHQW
eukprot:4498029-Amphidinium_carterae.1